MDKLFIVIPAYNEELNIKRVIDDWYPIVEKHNGNGGSRLVLIDDGSCDNTWDEICEYAKTRPLLKPQTKNNSGHGPTILWGYHYALKHGADFIFQTDSDGQTLPSEFEQFWKNRKKYDMVIGWRKNRQDGISRILVTKVLKCVVNLCFHVTIIDANTPFRLMDAKKLKEYIELIPDDFNLSNVLLSVIYARKNCRVKYIPITFRKRQGGINSINLRRIFKIGKKAVKDFQKLDKTI